MLSLLHIENIAVIEAADIAFDRGFNVLTGETGAGKSIVIDAINAILGERTYRDVIRTGANKATVRAVFTGVPELAWFSEFEVPYGDELLYKICQFIRLRFFKTRPECVVIVWCFFALFAPFTSIIDTGNPRHAKKNAVCQR